MKITILCVGKVKEKFFRDAISEYSKRLSRYCKLNILEVGDEKTIEGASETEIDLVKSREGERILSLIKDDMYPIALAIKGNTYDSPALADHLEKLTVTGQSHICFIIGGSMGLSEAVLNRCREKLSFSPMTFPHQLMRVILLEQIYRSFRIINHEPYHK